MNLFIVGFFIVVFSAALALGSATLFITKQEKNEFKDWKYGKMVDGKKPDFPLPYILGISFRTFMVVGGLIMLFSFFV